MCKYALHATGFKATEVCDAEKIEFVSEGGHILKGYMRHVCTPKEQEQRNVEK